MQVYRTVDGDMLDAICFKHYGHHTGTAEAVLEANPHLAEFGAKYPAGMVINLPDLPKPVAANSIRLWD